MAYNDQSEFPKGWSPSNTVSSLSATSIDTNSLRVANLVIQAGASGEDLIFRRPSAGAEYFRITLAANERVILTGFRACFNDGLELISTVNILSDLTVDINYYTAS